MAATPRVGDAGTVIRLRFRDEAGAVVNVGAAVAAGTKEIYLTRPDGSVVTLPASFLTDGTDGWVQVVTALDGTSPDTVPGTLNQHGNWLAHAWANLGGGTEFTTEPGAFYVGPSPRFPGV